MKVNRRVRTLLLLLLVVCGTCGGEAEPSAVVAKFVINFAKFTHWPAAPDGVGTICFTTVAEPVGAVLEGIENAAWVSRRGVGLDQLQGCRVLYLSRFDRYHLAETLRALREQPVLTISDLSGFAKLGGMVELYEEGRRFRFTINHAALEHAGLAMDARILALARSARGEP